MKRGTDHECQPEADPVCHIDFEDEMPDDFPERGVWHNEMLMAIEQETRVYLVDLSVAVWGDSEPDYVVVCGRLNAAGFDTYNSDTMLEVFSGPVTCDTCGKES